MYKVQSERSHEILTIQVLKGVGESAREKIHSPL